MIANHTSDAAIARRWRFVRWGPTGFHCPTCGHDQAWHLAPKRPRVFQCKKCRRQTSITSGTVMHGTKLPLEVWIARGEWHELNQLPTSRGFAEEHAIAASSAWHLNQRFMRGVDLGKPEHNEFGGCAVEWLPCRRPRPEPPVSEIPHPYLREKITEFLETPRGRRLPNAFVVGPGGTELVLLDPCASPEVARREQDERPLVIQVADRHRGFERFLRSILVGQLRTVCVRWLAAYLRCVLRIWSRITDPRTKDVPWLGALLAGPKRILARLRAMASR